jgi:ribosomal protein L7/L12
MYYDCVEINVTWESSVVKIFISYRRADSRKDSGRLYDRLVQAFGKSQIFKDVDNIPPGVDFRKVLSNAVSECDVLLVILGQQWLNLKDADGNRRIDDPLDFVRIEIETGLSRSNCMVIPVLVDNTVMPDAETLPESLRPIAFYNAITVRDDPDFNNDVTRLIRHIEMSFKTDVSSKGSSLQSTPSEKFDVYNAITQFYMALDQHDWNNARTLLAGIRDSGLAPRVFDLEAYEKKLWIEIEDAERNGDYEILRLIAKQNDQGLLASAIQKFREEHPDYDPDNLDVIEGYRVLLLDVGPKKINVVKAVRQITNLGLKEAKDLVEAVQKLSPGIVLTTNNWENATNAKQILEAQAARAEIRGAKAEVNLAAKQYSVLLLDVGPKKINVIKAVTQITNLGLKEAKDLVEAVRSSSSPGVVLVTKDTNAAIRAKSLLEAEGARAEIR